MEKLFHTQKSRLSLVVVGFTILYLVAFWSEIEQIVVIFGCAGSIVILTFLFWGRWFDVLLLSTVVVLIGVGIILALHFAFDSPFKWDERTAAASLNLAYTLISFLFAFYVSLHLVTRFVLPVQTRAERKDVLGRLWLYIRGKHGKAIFIKDGKVVGSEEETKLKGSGIALVDSASAIVLEKDMPPEQETVESRFGKRSTLSQILYEIEKKARKKARQNKV